MKYAGFSLMMHLGTVAELPGEMLSTIGLSQ
jgi:hypothetical protein